MDDEYVEQATTLHASDIDPGVRGNGWESRRDYYRRLAVANKLYWNGKWVDRKRKTGHDTASIVAAAASQLELTDYQKTRTQHLLPHVPAERIQGYKTATIALCLCGLVGRADGRDYHPNILHPDTSDVSDSGYEFAEFAEQNDISYTELSHCWDSIKTDLGDLV